MRKVKIRGRIVTRDKVLEAIEAFDQKYPDTKMYHGWLGRGNYVWGIHYEGKLYPCKHILSQASGIHNGSLNGGWGAGGTNGYLKRLGFSIVRKESAVSVRADEL